VKKYLAMAIWAGFAVVMVASIVPRLRGQVVSLPASNQPDSGGNGAPGHGSAMVTRTYNVSDILPRGMMDFLSHGPSEQAKQRQAAIIKLITSGVDSGSWQGRGGAGAISVVDRHLVVTQTSVNQDSIAVMVEQIEALADKHWEGWFWFTFGLIGNFVFGSRFFLQWLHSERKQQSEVPVYFWWLSIVGVVMLFVYFMNLRNLVGLLGNGPQIVPYIRNLMLIHKRKKLQSLAAVGGAISQ